MTADIYIRVSTEEQAQKWSLPAQEQELCNYAAQHGIQINQVITDSSSGMNFGRPGLQRLILDVEENKIDTILITESNRLARDPQILGFMRIRCMQKGIKIITVNEPEIPGTEKPSIGLLQDVTAASAKYEYYLRQDVISRARRQAALEGKTAHKIPFGYKAMKDSKLILNEDEAKVIRKLFQNCIDHPNWKFTMWLRESGFLAKNMSECAQRILTNPFYIGKVSIGGELIDGPHPRIVEKEMWDKAQKIIVEKKAKVNQR